MNTKTFKVAVAAMAAGFLFLTALPGCTDQEKKKTETEVEVTKTPSDTPMKMNEEQGLTKPVVTPPSPSGGTVQPSVQ